MRHPRRPDVSGENNMSRVSHGMLVPPTSCAVGWRLQPGKGDVRVRRSGAAQARPARGREPNIRAGAVRPGGGAVRPGGAHRARLDARCRAGNAPGPAPRGGARPAGHRGCVRWRERDGGPPDVLVDRWAGGDFADEGCMGAGQSAGSPGWHESGCGQHRRAAWSAVPGAVAAEAAPVECCCPASKET